MSSVIILTGISQTRFEYFQDSTSKPPFNILLTYLLILLLSCLKQSVSIGDFLIPFPPLLVMHSAFRNTGSTNEKACEQIGERDG